MNYPKKRYLVAIIALILTISLAYLIWSWRNYLSEYGYIVSVFLTPILLIIAWQTWISNKILIEIMHKIMNENFVNL